MKKGLLKIYLSCVLLCAVSIASMPLSLLHDHHHEVHCELGWDVPLKFKKDKDQSPVHLHEYADECFLCFESHFLNADLNADVPYIIHKALTVKYRSISVEFFSQKIESYNNRGPPRFLYDC